MATTADYLSQLQADKQALVNNLVEKGVEATSEETFTSLVPKVLDIQSDSGGIEDYFETTLGTSGTMTGYIKNIPPLDASACTALNSFLFGYSSLNGNITINTPNCTTFNSMFYGAFDTTNDHIVTMEDMSKGTSMSAMFETSNVTDVIFNNTQNVTTMSALFRDALRLKSITGLDTSSCTDMNQMFYLNNNRNRPNLTEIPAMNTRKATNMNSMFYNCKNIITIPELNAESCVNVTNMFFRCSGLVNFGGLKDLGKAYLTTVSANYSNYTLTLSNASNLTHDSLMNVINGLYDIASLGVQLQKLVLGSTNLAKLTEEEIAIATNKGWTVS